ncbi:Uncharacterized protein Adt_38728 [Abeliophyllum distichum]|uniref:Uncharacterized protein n=1 Tax=Abeliophyllum distichum TaxID=126358 RepID=A0ABD1Q323_9LAMI
MIHEKKVIDLNVSHTTEVVDHKKSTKHRMDVLDGKTIMLCYIVKTIEEKVETAEADICELYIQLDESRTICTAMTNADAIIHGQREEMETMRIQLRILQYAIGNDKSRTRPSFLYTLGIKDIEEATGPIPKLVRRLLQEFEDVISDELLRKLPPKRNINHKIEHISSAKPPSRALYCIAQPEFDEIRK